MKRLKREENAIIIHFMFYLVLSVGLVIFTFSNILPQIKVIESNKAATKIVFDSIVRIEKSGLTFDEFKVNNGIGGNNRVVTEILKSMTKDFYNDSLVNTNYATYNEFLDSKNNELNSIDNKAIVEEKNKKISKILPAYSENTVNFGGDILTDYKFINYIESIIETFNFNSNDSIGISKLSLLKDFAVNSTDGDSLDSNMYFIPLKLTIKGTKSGIIDFLYFIKNVGNIEIIDNDIIINDDYGYLSKNGIKKVLEGDKLTKDYNIFEHQIIDISRISIPDYIDSSYLPRGDKDFKDFIMDTQGSDEFEVSLDLMFYVKGQPNYVIEEFITGIFDKYKKTVGLVNNELKSTDIKGIERINLNKYNETLKLLNKEVLNLRKELSKKDKLDLLYKNVIKLDGKIDPIFKKLNK